MPSSLLPQDAQSFLHELLHRYRSLKDGAPVDYIPQLAEVNPDRFAIAVATVEGEVLAVGDTKHEFTLQSVSKPFTYGLALTLAGREAVRRKIDVEPTGDPFNSLVELEDGNHRPYNPMVNSGAIAATGIVHEHLGEHTREWLQCAFAAYAGRALRVDERLIHNELDTGHRNRAIAHLLKHFGILAGPVDEVLNLYTAQCATMVNTVDLAWMGATLAHGGVHPRTGERAIETALVHDLVTLMFTCGMYDSAGRWAFEVGLPAKSGVGGGLLAVVPGRMGIAAYSPRLARGGHSVRGMKVMRDLSLGWGLSVIAW